MHVVATAGHVDHGKSTLVRALTGMEPDRWAEERWRGLTIDLGFAWTTLDGAGQLAFVDVPGHRRFIGNMLAGLGPSPAVLFVVAADSGWMPQSQEHLRAVDALGLRHGLIAVTRCDLVGADRSREVAEDVVARLGASSLGPTPSVCVSAVTGEGLPDLRAGLAQVCARLPAPRPDGRVRLWIDRAFSVRGSGTVVTGTLTAGSLRVGDQVSVGGRVVGVRGLQALGARREVVGAVARVAVNLRGVAVAEIHRGTALLTPAAWPATTTVDVLVGEPAGFGSDATGGSGAGRPPWPTWLTVHVGTAAVEARVRPLGREALRLALIQPLPLTLGDRLILRDPGGVGVLSGAVVADIAPPSLHRRGAGARRAVELGGRRSAADLGGSSGAAGPAAGRAGSEADLAAAGTDAVLDLVARDVRSRGWLGIDQARRLGHDVDALDERQLSAAGVLRIGDQLVSREQASRWQQAVTDAVLRQEQTDPLDPWLSAPAARTAASIPDTAVLQHVSQAAGLVLQGGRLHRPGVAPTLGPAEAGLAEILARLDADPCAAPEADTLTALGLGERQLAAAEATGRVLRLRDGIVVAPTSPARVMRVLAGLPQPFTTSQARAALGSTRRVVIPLLEHLDARGWTRRVDGAHREVVRPAQ